MIYEFEQKGQKAHLVLKLRILPKYKIPSFFLISFDFALLWLTTRETTKTGTLNFEKRKH